MNFGMGYQSGGGGGGGGGYTNNDAAGSQDSNKRRNYDDQTLIPVTLQMALNAQPDQSGGGGDGSLVLQDGRPVSLVKIIGAVRMFEEQSTNVLYRIEDGTGVMEVKQWVDDNDCSALAEIKQSTLQENIYIKAIGQIKEYNNEKMIVASMVRPLTTGNELTHHFLEVVHSAEKSKRVDSIVAPVMPSVANNMMGGGMMSNNAVPGGSDLSQNIMNYLKENGHTETGVNIEECIRSMPNHSEAEIRQVVSMLAEEGHVYSTISENHYKIAM